MNVCHSFRCFLSHMKCLPNIYIKRNVCNKNSNNFNEDIYNLMHEYKLPFFIMWCFLVKFTKVFVCFYLNWFPGIIN